MGRRKNTLLYRYLVRIGIDVLNLVVPKRQSTEEELNKLHRVTAEYWKSKRFGQKMPQFSGIFCPNLFILENTLAI